VRTLPLVLGLTVATIIAGGSITAIGHYMPFMILSGVMSVCGAAALYTMNVDTGSSAWIGFQALAGLGYGFGVQLPIIAAQAMMAPEDISTATAMILFSQTMGGSLTISAAQSAFLNTLLQNLAVDAPGVDPALVVATGATAFRNVFPIGTIPGIVAAYMSGLKSAYAIGTAMAGMMLLVASFGKWHNLKAVNEERARLEKEAARSLAAPGPVMLPAEKESTVVG